MRRDSIGCYVIGLGLSGYATVNHYFIFLAVFFFTMAWLSALSGPRHKP